MEPERGTLYIYFFLFWRSESSGARDENTKRESRPVHDHLWWEISRPEKLKKKKKEWNHFHNNPLNLEGDGKWEKSGRTDGNGRRKMKYYRGLNNVGPRGKCSPHAALIAFISIPFIASSLLSRRAIGTPSRWRIPKIDPKLVSRQALLIPPKHSAFSFSEIRK